MEAMGLHPRNAEPLLLEALSDTPVVALQGARQCGKSTLAGQVAERPERGTMRG